MKVKKIILLTILVLVTSVGNAQTSFFNKLKTRRVASSKEVFWEQVGPGNAGFANLLRYHPTLPGVITQCPDMWNAYQSENNGKKWYGITDSDGDAEFFI
ncbi:hypothetical protein FHR24_002510 [Wenyingzhuangia heitensis]|uniref:Uncharacterized protein n=1 Tax=Wenyingzhuangia heitensis TaxID=1487859 RepID=A0ABX0UB30_9FLAO|nr:hypothetical protein [Wenyingzhuangia heitensis]NIJ46032.1 hypothetical protein [Wenyingzhuangia heitensis]